MLPPSGSLASSQSSGQRLGVSMPLALAQDGERFMRICNACRYCEGYCAVFPALERRLSFTEQDLHYLANLCHDCGECLYACQYAPPHEFGVALPTALAAIRRETYREYAWPSTLSGLFARPWLPLGIGAVVLPLVALALLGALVPAAVLFSAHPDPAGAFYGVVPHGVMVGVFSVVGLAVLVALVAGPVRFSRDLGVGFRDWRDPRVLARVIKDAATLRYLDGGGEGCAYPNDVPSRARRWLHHATFYGFLLCFAATTVAAGYHNLLGWRAPYPLASIPVVLGSLGGLGLLVGPAGLLWLKRQRDPEATDVTQASMDVAFLVMLWLTSATGFALLALREHAAMGLVLGLHLGIVAGLFVTMPYGKFVHGLYRLCALAKNAVEAERRP